MKKRSSKKPAKKRNVSVAGVKRAVTKAVGKVAKVVKEVAKPAKKAATKKKRNRTVIKAKRVTVLSANPGRRSVSARSRRKPGASRLRNVHRISPEAIKKFPPHIQEQYWKHWGAIEASEEKAKTPAARKRVAKRRKSFLSRLGTRLRVLGRSKKYTVSARKCEDKRIKVRAATETDARSKAKTKLRGFKDFKVENCGRKRNVTARPRRKPGASRRRNDGAEGRREQFAGKVTGHKELYFPTGTPQGLSTLGPLRRIRTDAGDIVPARGTAYLCEDAKHRLHIGTSSPNAPLIDGPARSFRKVHRIEYDCRKPHLGYPQVVTWFHDFKDPLPTLKSDGQGGLSFGGGGYTIAREGIVG